MSKSARCQNCQLRPVGGGKGSGYEDVQFCKQNGYCLPCGDEGQMSIAHMNGHESIPEAECWYCHPELDETKQPYTERTGSSRAGIVQHVSIRATGKEKAEQVASQLEDYKCTIRTNKGIVTLRATEGIINPQIFVMQWYVTGQLVSAVVLREGTTRKLRNAAEVIRNA